jgi:YVTN family beta-propeller protein
VRHRHARKPQGGSCLSADITTGARLALRFDCAAYRMNPYPMALVVPHDIPYRGAAPHLRSPITAKISIPGSPDWVGNGPNAVWISNGGRDSLARIDPAKNKVAKTVPVGRRPCSGLAVGFDAIPFLKLPILSHRR